MTLRLRPLMSTTNMMFGVGGLSLIFASILTWRSSWQTKSLTPATSNKMPLVVRTVMVTGASRGLGLEYVKQLVKLPSPPEVLIAACRSPQSSTQLQAVAKENPTVKLVMLDVENDESIKSAYKEVKALVGDQGLNLLVNNAAMYDQSVDGKLAQQTRPLMRKHFEVNVLGPLMVTQTFLPLLEKAATHKKDAPLSFSRAGVVMMTSYQGSQQITYNDGAGVSIHYKVSKSALNMMSLMLSRELKDSGILVSAVHPGWVKTAMGGPDAMFTPEESIKGCLNVIGSAGEDLNGKLVTFEGNELPY